MQTMIGFLFVFATGGVLLILERLLPLHPGQNTLRPGWKIDLMHVFLSGTLIRLGTTVAVLAASVFAISAVPEPLRQAVRAQPDWLEFLELLVLSDLCLYAAHRLCHAVPLLWRFHAVHHSSENLDWLAAYRVHPVDQILNSTMMALPAIVLGFSPLPLLIYAIVYRIHAPLLHSNVRLDLGPLGVLLTSPRFHHWHHADQAEAYDRNFAGQLSFIDRLFGTHYAPGEGSLPARYGVGGAVPENYVGQLLQPFGVTLSPNAVSPAGQGVVAEPASFACQPVKPGLHPNTPAEALHNPPATSV
ncbi:MAG TPA: sterol desaturase family protein [Brevundimonas sp.]